MSNFNDLTSLSMFAPIEIPFMRAALACICLFLSTQILAQANKSDYQLKICRSIDPIVIDGLMAESTWKTASKAKDFWQKSPRDDVRSKRPTEVSMAYDDQMIYVAFKCYDPDKNHILQTLKRDESFWDSDGVAVVLDPIGEATGGFFFAINTQGAQNDALVGGGTGPDQYSDEWNNKWYAETAQQDSFWTAEIGIPFKTIRYDPTDRAWGINFTRLHAKHNEMDVWARIPRQFWPIDLGYAGELSWQDEPIRAQGNVSVIPYITTSSVRDFEAGTEVDRALGLGMDAKIALSSALNLDLTVNPDFSQVEVDRQVTNLTRFSIFFPERRNFFLENSDLFSNFGDPLLRPFFSRRIGLNAEGEPVPIQFGVRLSGNATENLRIGLLDVHTGKLGETPAQNYFTGAFSHRLFGRTKITGIVINRQAFEGAESLEGNYARNAGLEFSYQSTDGTWQSWLSHHISDKPNVVGDNSYTSLGAEYAGNRFNATLALASVGTNYFADVGFVNRIFLYDAVRDEQIRQGYKYLFLPIEYTYIPDEIKSFQGMDFSLENFILLNPTYRRIESSHKFEYQIRFVNSSSISVSADHSDVILQYPFGFADGEPLPTDRYLFTSYGLEYKSDERKLFNYSLGLQAGGFYNGTIQQVELSLKYRRQPWGLLSFSGQYNDLEFPEPYGASKLWLLGPRLELALSRDFFWTTFLQYNTQAENFNVNSRLQWQFKPLSWAYLVYNDNYVTSPWAKKNRALVLKVNYWLTL